MLLLEHLEHTDMECLIFITLAHKVFVDPELCSGHGFTCRDAGKVKAKLSAMLMIQMEVFFWIHCRKKEITY